MDSSIKRPLKNAGRVGVALCFLCVAIIGILWHDARSFVSPQFGAETIGRRIKAKASPAVGVLQVGIIGDSWACGRGLADALEKHLSHAGLSAKVTSFGHGGAKSRDILLNLLKPEDAVHSSRPILTSNTDLCCVVCGVNDSAGYIGADFYSFHVAGIAKLLHHHGVFPIILDVPEFGIEESSSISFLGAGKRTAMRWLLHAGERDVIAAYREALRSTLQAELPSPAYKLVSFNAVCEDYTQARHLYTKDMCHLNTDGLSRLAAALSDGIIAYHSEVPAVTVQE